MRRKYQQGNVFQKGRKHSDRWLPDEPAYIRFWQDASGQIDPRRTIVALGICRTRTIAERKGSEELEKLGVNSSHRFIEGTTNITFKKQGEMWLKSLETRKRNPLEQTTIDNRRYYLDKWIYPFLGDRLLGQVNNLAVKELVETRAPKLSPASIRDYVNIVKGVVASARNEDGEEVFPRKWNDDFIDAPVIDSQRQPSTNADGATAIIGAATGQFQMLYVLLAGCGPLRVGEAPGLDLFKHFSPDFRTIYVAQKAKRGELQPYLKTKNGIRQIDLCVDLARMLQEFVGERTTGLLFRTSTGAQVLQANTLQDSLHPILKSIKHVKGGFNIFRRFRITYLETSDCPEALRHFWSGHAQKHVSERYIKLLNDRQYRLDWAERIGLGFRLPASIGQLGQLRVLPRVA